MKQLKDMTLEELLTPEGHPCTCGRTHCAGLRFLKIGSGVIRFLPDALKAIGITKPFIIYDQNTWRAAGAPVEKALAQADVPYAAFRFPQAFVEPDEHAVEQLKEAFDASCDGILAVGSGVINDCGKVLAHDLHLPQAVAGTAPSMDGYASNSSSMIQNKVKVTVYNACPQAILADTAIMKNAPEHMLQAGLGDMLAKYIAVCEWRISHIVTGEYYCKEIAALMRSSLAKIVAAAPGLPTRDEQAVEAVAEGLILSGLAMAFAEISRPASGLEHYFSHVWEMLAIAHDQPHALHGIQVGVGTLLSLRVLDRLRTLTPNENTVRQAIRAFDPKAWEADMHRVFGDTAATLIEKEYSVWHKNDPEGRMQRFTRVQEHWADIVQIMAEELPATADVLTLMQALHLPIAPKDIGVSDQEARDAFIHSRDIRDKYLTSSMLWDMGILDDFPLSLE